MRGGGCNLLLFRKRLEWDVWLCKESGIMCTAKGNNHILYLLTKTTRCHPKVTASVGRQTTGKKAVTVDSNYKPISN